MENTGYRAIAIVGAAAVLPDAPNVTAFWQNVRNGRYSISEVNRDRWDPARYYDPDPSAPDKTYSKIGGWVKNLAWDPAAWHLPIPPRVLNGMDEAQKWAISCTRAALDDYGYPNRALDANRVAVILGNAMAGEKHYLTSFRVFFPEYAHELAECETFAALPAAIQRDVTRELQSRIGKLLPEITEDSMPGELSNCIAGRIANLYNFHGPNYVTDAACASAMAAMSASIEGLIDKQFDVAITGGIDRNMGPSTFVKFCKIGALSATGSRPYAAGADGFVMGEGAVIFILKRLADAERDGDQVYAVIRGIGGSSDGKGKGITAPNPVGQKLCIERAWENAGLSPASATLIEGHGTSTRVGDVVEVQSMADVLCRSDVPFGEIALGSVKSNIGHLKGAAGAAGLLKTALALRDHVVPPSVQCDHPNPDIDFAHCPLYVNTKLHPWDVHADAVRRAGVSAFGFGGTNFHVVLEEYIPHRLGANGKTAVAMAGIPDAGNGNEKHLFGRKSDGSPTVKAPLRGALVIGGAVDAELAERLRSVQRAAAAGRAPAPAPPTTSDLRAPERIAIDYADARDLAEKADKALKALATDQPGMWKALRAQGVFRGHGAAPKVAFLYPGQGSQYVNMLQDLRAQEPIVAETFAEADRILAPLLGRKLTDVIFINGSDAALVAQAEDELRQTAITQPAVLAVDLALTRLFAAYGIEPDMAMGHSLGEYGALVAAGGMPFADALEAVSARGREMTRVSVADNGRMAAVFAPLDEIQKIVSNIDGYVVIANLNSEKQAVIGGATKPVEAAMEAFVNAGYNVVPLPVSHAFHTSIVAPASEPLRDLLRRLQLQAPRVPVVANVDGEFYPSGPKAPAQMADILARQVASPVQFVKGLQKLYDSGARVFVEVGPKKALQGFVEDVLGNYPGVVPLFANHPKVGDIAAFNQALCGLYAAGLGRGNADDAYDAPSSGVTLVSAASSGTVTPEPVPPVTYAGGGLTPPPATPVNGQFDALGRIFAEALEKGWHILHKDGGAQNDAPVVITGASLGLPGTEHIFDDANIGRILAGEQFIDTIPMRHRRAVADKHITRLVKSGNGEATFETITSTGEVIKLAGRGGAFDLTKEFGIPEDRVAAFDRDTALAIAVGIDALRDAGIPLVLRYKTTSKGTQLPDRWGLPESIRDDTGIIFACVFPGCDSFADDMARYYEDRARRDQLALLESLRQRAGDVNGNGDISHELNRRITDLKAAIAKDSYVFDRRFMFRLLSMGHSQFAELIGCRGPNTQINAACASTTQAVAVAEDWIKIGRCKRVIIVSADDITTDHVIEWFAAGFLATGAAATDDVVEEAALPFDRRRHGMIMGMGAAAIVVESAEAARERGMNPICDVLSTIPANSAFHGTRLDVEHITQVMEKLVARAEASCGIPRHQLAEKMVFVSHETYTPARGGSASAEIHALRTVFGPAADKIVIANTKGFTGHAMGAGIEDVVAIKALETGCVPPVANFKEVDPELGSLNLSKGGEYPVEFALRLGAGFGSQISMTLLRRLPSGDGVRRSASQLGYEYRITDRHTWQAWLASIAGHPAAELEVVNRTLRVRDHGAQRVVESEKTVSKKSFVASATVAAAEPTARQPVSKTSTADAVKQRVMALVAEKTGYPTEMLDPELDLEADLGIDTVKQAEVFASIREAYSIARDDKIRLRDFPTLGHVIGFVLDHRPDLAGAAEVPPPASPAPAVPVAEALTTTAADPVTERILDLVVEKTGYPRDMLDVALDLEADLGVDTVKQAELFAAIREIYSIPRDGALKLRDFPTLAHVVRFVYDRRPDLARAPEPVPVAAIVPSPEPAVAHTADADEIAERVLAIVAEKTGYPREMLDPDLDLEADLGIDTVKQAEMFASVRTAFNIPRDGALKLRDFPTLAHVIRFARDRAVADTGHTAPIDTAAAPVFTRAEDAVRRRVPAPVLRPPLEICKQTGVTLQTGSRVIIMPDTGGVAGALTANLIAAGVEVLELDRSADSDAAISDLKAWSAAGPITGVYWLPAVDAEGDIDTMQPDAWREGLRLRVKSLYTTMRVLYNTLAERGTFLITATRLGGQHGYDESGALAPMGGGVAGFAKSYKRERPNALIKVVDFGGAEHPANVAQALIDETLRDPGAVEIGYKDDLRWTVGLADETAGHDNAGLDLNDKTVFVITGAAGSIVSAITVDLAAASRGTFYLLDLTPEPRPEDPDLKRFATDKDALKRDIFARIQARGERATPALVEKEMAALERSYAALSAIEAVRAAGGAAEYFSVDLTNPDQVGRVFDRIREKSGHIDVLVHAAGVEKSHFLTDKEAREFDLVFDVKADGWFNLIRAAGNMPIAATVAFSSIAGRFGNAGQTDYSAANDLLCKIASSFRTTHPATRAIAIDWTAWADIGMASRGSIPKMMEAAGIEMLPARDAIPIVRRELTAGGRSGEVVIAGQLGILMNEWHSTGGLDVKAAERLLSGGTMTGRVTQCGVYDRLRMEVDLDPTVQPFLHDHQIDGTPVMPGVMAIEAFAETAAAFVPGWHVDAVEDVEFLAPFKFYRNEPRTLTVEAVIQPKLDEIVAECHVFGRRVLAAQAEPQVTEHFRGRVRLRNDVRVTAVATVPVAPRGSTVEASDIYRVYFHGPAYRVLERAWVDDGNVVGQMASDLPDNHSPAARPLLTSARLVELCFQTAGIWEMAALDYMGLPLHVDLVRFFRSADTHEGTLYAIVRPDGAAKAFDAEVVDSAGNLHLRLTGYRTVALPNKIDAEPLEALHAVMA